MKYLIVGMGRSGEAARKLLEASGIERASIRTFDDKAGADYSDPEKALREFDPRTLIVSPGYPLSRSWIQAACQGGRAITSEISLACQYLADEKIIGVTGSVGKSTTVALLNEGARSFDEHAFIGGNFGIALCEYAWGVLTGQRPRAQWLILELSSFQLENCDGLNLDYAAITFFSANHLERYQNQDEYYATKWRLAEICRTPVFINATSPDLVTFAKARKETSVAVDRSSPALETYRLADGALLGAHNQDNMALASSLALAAGWPVSSIESMKRFRGLSHRLENVGTIDGIRFVNDSKATAMDSVLIAVQSCLPQGGHLYVLLGGKDKNLPWQDLRTLRSLANLKPIFFGHCGGLAKERSGLEGPVHGTLGDAIDFAKSTAQTGDTILLSPGGTSLDEFKNFEERGDFFKKRIRG